MIYVVYLAAVVVSVPAGLVVRTIGVSQGIADALRNWT